jgi:cell wall-associated NlpC family hydrolase
MNLRMPFAQNNERDVLIDEGWEFVEGGKGDPVYLWGAIGDTISTEDFSRYVETLADGREKVIIFEIPTRTWTASRDLFDIARMKAGAYHGLPHRPYVLVSGRGIEETDVYNYLYCVGWVGMDCSGFVWHVLSYMAQAGGVNLGQVLRGSMGVPRGGNPSWYAGTSFYNSGSREIIPVQDTIADLKPGDILLFRGMDGNMVHSAIIQSVNLTGGVIRYLQSTDEAPLTERGAHESYITFDPEHPEMSLKDPAIQWNQKRYSPFPGEQAPPFSDDGERYRAFPEHGGGRVVRLRALAGPIEKINSRALP